MTPRSHLRPSRILSCSSFSFASSLSICCCGETPSIHRVQRAQSRRFSSNLSTDSNAFLTVASVGGTSPNPRILLLACKLQRSTRALGRTLLEKSCQGDRVSAPPQAGQLRLWPGRGGRNPYRSSFNHLRAFLALRIAGCRGDGQIAGHRDTRVLLASDSLYTPRHGVGGAAGEGADESRQGRQGRRRMARQGQ